jgi:hypothetical protein
MSNQFGLPKDWRPPAGKRGKPRRDYLISALWGLLDGETLRGLGGVEKSVLICVAAWASWESGEVRLTRSSLAKHTGHDESVCRRAVSSLVNKGVLEVVHQGSNGRGNSTVHRLAKTGRPGPKNGAPRSVKRGAQVPTNKDHPRMIQGAAADAASPRRVSEASA